MSQRATSFVVEWVRENVNAQPYLAEGGDMRPRQLADECLAAAAAAGISKAEIEEDVDLEATIEAAIEEAADNEVDRLASKDKT